MNNLRMVGTIGSLWLLLLAAAVIFVTGRQMLAIRPADSYEDAGVHSFLAYRVLPRQVPNTGATGRYRRMNPTRTVYEVHYLATDGSGYQCSEQVMSRDFGQDMVDGKLETERRVLRISADGAYITVGANQTAESYTAGLQQKYVWALVPSGAYILLYLLVKIVFLVKRNRKAV